jgi:hydroxyethylthiazole kinase-like uncharacterized protein yjeF
LNTISLSDIATLLKHRQANSHKGDYGHALIIAGNIGKMGAAVIAARACMRSGVGQLTVNIPRDERFVLQTAIPEAMCIKREVGDYDFSIFSSIGIGSGLGVDKEQEKILKTVITKINKPLVMDADALNIISNSKKLLSKIPPHTIITPHPKEFDRMFGTHATLKARISKAISKAAELNIVIVLKGNETLVTNGTESWMNTAGNAGLAKSGSGDALTGMITAFLAQGYEPLAAAKIAIYIHGMAADITLKNQSMESMLITDVIESFGDAFKFCLK